MATRIGEALVEQGLLTRTQLDQALQAQLMLGGHVGTSLIELGFISEETFGRELARARGMRHASSTSFEHIPRAVLEALPYDVIVQRKIIPIALKGRELHVAVIDSKNLSSLSALTGRRIVLHLAPEIRILEALERYYGVRRRTRYIVPQPSSIPIGVAREPLFRKPPPRPAAPAGRISTGQVLAVNAELRELSERMSRVETHVELGDLLIDQALDGCVRRILFAVTDGEAEVVNTRGVDEHLSNWQGMRIPVDRNSIFALAAEESYFRGLLPQGFAGRAFFRELGLVEPKEILLLPVYGEDSLEAVLYGDGGPDGQIDDRADSHEPTIELASLAVRMLSLRTQLCSAQNPTP